MLSFSELASVISDRMHSLTGVCEIHGERAAWLRKEVTDWACPACAEEAHVAATRKAHADERLKSLGMIAMVPAKYVGKRFTSTTDDHKAARHVGKAFMEVAVAAGEWAALVLSGEAGTGKTLMASEMIERYIERTMKMARYVTATGMIAEIHEAYRSDTKTEASEIKKFAEYGLLVIDEIDLIRSTDNSQGLLTEVINARYNNSKPVIVITNKPRGDLVQYVGSRVDDRLYENGFLSLFTWASFRRVAG